MPSFLHEEKAVRLVNDSNAAYHDVRNKKLNKSILTLEFLQLHQLHYKVVRELSRTCVNKIHWKKKCDIVKCNYEDQMVYLVLRIECK